MKVDIRRVLDPPVRQISINDAEDRVCRLPRIWQRIFGMPGKNI